MVYAILIALSTSSDVARAFDHCGNTFDNTDFPGGDLDGLSTASSRIYSMAACINMCQGSSNCKHCSWFKKIHTCYLKNSQVEPKVNSQVKSWRKCTGSCGSTFDGTDFFGEKMSSPSGAIRGIYSMEDCIGKCQSSLNCKQCTWVMQTNSCYLKNSMVNPVVNSEAVSWEKCTGSCGNTFDDTDLFGGDIHGINTARSGIYRMVDCIAMCQRSSDCEQCTWVMETHSCYLKNSLVTPVVDTGTKSWRKCTVDCSMIAWETWSECSTVCGSGSQTRSRSMIEPQSGEKYCIGDNSATQACIKNRCPVRSNWSAWGPCANTCGHGTRVRHCNNPTPLDGGDECAGSSSQECTMDPCPIHCEWDMWSSWNNQCEGECGLVTAKKYRFRMFKVEAKYNGNPCVGTGVESELCDFQECPLRMKCEGKVIEEAPTKKILSEGKENCHRHCRSECTQDELCANIHSRRGKVWRDPKWTLKWYGTHFNKFVGDIALIESFSYPKMALSDAAAAAMVASCPWLIPTCINRTNCDFGHPFTRQNVTHFLDNFYKWYFSAADADGQSQFGGERSKIPAGGKNIRLDDMASPDACQRRCKIWCYEACKCNWSWEFPYSNDQGLGWRYKKPMRYRWVPSEGNLPFYGTWKCISSRNVSLAVPWDSPSWSIDLYSEAVKREAQRRFVASGSLTNLPLEYRLVCLHVRDWYSRATNGGKTTVTPLNCTRAPAVVITYLHQKNMLRNEYMESSEKRKKLTSTLRKDIRKNCRRTCAEAHVPDFEVAYPNV